MLLIQHFDLLSPIRDQRDHNVITQGITYKENDILQYIRNCNMISVVILIFLYLEVCWKGCVRQVTRKRIKQIN